MSEPNIEVVLTGVGDIHCFKLIFHVIPENGAERVPCEIFLHTTQAIDLFGKLATQLSAYFNQASAELLAIKSRS